MLKKTGSIQAFKQDARGSYDVIIVGAGIAAASAALELSKTGKKILILQANNYIGGRMKTEDITLFDGQNVNFELGANWIHGSNPSNPITQLAMEMRNVDLLQSDYQSLLVYDEQGKNITQSANKKYTEYEESFNSFQQQENKNSSFYDALKLLSPTALHDKQFMFAVSNDFQFDQAQSIENVNAHFVQGRQWMEGVDQLVMSGYQRFPEYLAQKSKAKILLNHKVTQITRANSGDKTTVKCSNGFTAQAQSVIIGVPLGVLKKNTIKFTPELPRWKTDAIDKIGFGNVVKIMIAPKTAFHLPQPTQFLGVVANDINQRGSATFFLNFQSVANRTALMTFGVGPNANELQVMPEAQLKTLIAQRLSLLKNSPILSSDFDIFRSNWKTNPNFGGAYSFPGVQTNILQWKNMAKPLQDRNWYFCGEHTYNTQRSTVNGAYLSGLAAAKDVLKRQKQTKDAYQ